MTYRSAPGYFRNRPLLLPSLLERAICLLSFFAMAHLAAGANLTTTNLQLAPANWTATIWKTNTFGMATNPAAGIAPVAGNTYEAVFNGSSIGNGLNNTRIRNPAATGLQTFPGDSLTMYTNTELRAKQPGAILNFPAIGGSAGLILNGGMLNGGDDATFVITGRVQVASQSYISHGANGGGGGISPNRAFNFNGVLSGTGNLVILNAGTVVPQQVSGPSNTFSGQWIVQCGWLKGNAPGPGGTNTLGTNGITVDPLYSGEIAAMPNFQATTAQAWFEPNYDMNSAGKLTLTNGGIIVLHQNCIFSAINIETKAVPPGTHYYSDLAANFPSSFANGGSGSLTVQPYGPPPVFAPTIVSQPLSVTLLAGSPTQLVATANGTAPLSYQWQKGTNGSYINLSDGGDVTGSRTNILIFGGLQISDGADYRLIVTNSAGAATSQVATVTVYLPDTTHPTVAALNPTAGSTVNNLTQIQVTFSEVVVGADSADLLINGVPAEFVSGSGSNYLFSFSQPLSGTVLVYFDIDNGVTDLSGNPLDTSGSWTYTLTDRTPPALASMAPAAGATVSALAQVQVIFTEPVSGVAANSLLVNGTPAINVTGSGLGPYVFQFPQPGQGNVTFSWAPGQNIRDLSSNSNLFVPSGWAVTLDTPAALSALTNIVINEFLASNQSTNGLRDEDLLLSDWIELYNRGSTSVNLTGWALTDDSTQPAQWVLPATNLAAGQYMVIFASGEDRRSPGGNLHTNFKLTSSGHYLGLYNADLPSRAAFEYASGYPSQFPDISYGLDNNLSQRYFSIQTPGGPNSVSTITGVVAAVHLSVNHGFFNLPFNLDMSCTTPGATILYTTDGSVPSIAGGVTNGTVYASPLLINHTTALRAAAFAPDLLPSPAASQTYLFVEDIVLQPNNPAGYPTGNVWTPTPGLVQSGSQSYYQMNQAVVSDSQYSNDVRAGLVSIPTCSIIMPIPDLFDPNIGIYTHPTNRSTGWERACSMELIFPDGSQGTTLDCGLQIQGGTQRDPAKNAKHSFRVQFKGDYGNSTLDFPIFPDSPVNSFKTLVLDGGINLWWQYVGTSSPADQRYRASCVRDQYSSDLSLALGRPGFHGRFYHVYLNGLYWGLHYIHERPDEDYAASYLGGDSSDYDVIKNTTFGTQIVAGDLNAWNTALSLSNSGLTNNAQYAQLQQYVDMDNLIDNMIVNHWVGNVDWPQHNWYVIRNRTNGTGFKFIVWDTEHVLKDANQNVVTANTAGSPAQIYNALRNNTEFRLLYADHLQKLFFNGGLFYSDSNPTNALWDPAHPERNIPAAFYMKRIAEITNAIVDESARWGGYYGVTSGAGTNYTRNDQWLLELNNLLGYTNTAFLGNTANLFPTRSTTVLNQYKAIGLFPSVNAPVFSSMGGTVPAGFSLTMTNLNPGGTIFYTTNGVDPRVYGSGAVLPGALAYTNGSIITLNSSVPIKARVLNGSWSALTEADFNVALMGIPIRITELMYNPIGGDAYEYVELQNIGSFPVDLSGFSFEGITYIFPNGSMLAPGAVITLASSVSPSNFASRYPGVVVFGYYGDKLANGGERIALLDQYGNTVISVDYQNSGGWPTAANGGGYSLEIINPNGDPDDPANWRSSLNLNGSPGVMNASIPLATVRINEVMAENSGAVTNGTTTNSDWVELYNAGSSAANIANWSFSNSGNARKYVFPTGTTIPAGGYLVLWCDNVSTAPGLHSGFTLGRKGENLFLYDANTNRIDAFSFGLQLTNYTVGRLGAGANWQLTLPTPAANNVAAAVGSATNLAINEWLANSTSAGSDWIELFNKSSTQPVVLANLFLGTSNDLFQIRSVSFIPPLGFVQLFADKNAGFDHLDFKLTAGGDAVVLYDYSGQQVDRVSFINQLDGISQGRLPDGSINIAAFPGSGSPGASNYVAAYTGPRLNEIMARNISSVYGLGGKNPDWLELNNPNPTSFSLAGMSLSTDASAPGQWTFPAGVNISSNGYLVVWCDNSSAGSTNATTNLNTGFSLAGGGGGLYLFKTNGQMADFIVFGPQIADASIGISAGAWSLLSSPTPGLANSAAAPLGNPANLKINEWMADPVSGDDWFEVYNSDASPVRMDGLYLTDDPSAAGMTNFTVPLLSFVAGHGWLEYHADGHASAGPNHVSFSLDKNGEGLRIYSTNLALIDTVDFSLQLTGVSQGRLPDGASNIVSFPATPTPEASNYLPLQNVLVNEVLSHTDPPLEDAIEFFNPTTNSVSMGGWFISNSQADFRRYRMPNGTSISAGGYKVFYEYQFNGSNSSPFTLNSAHGDSVFLSEADGAGNLTGNRAQVSFGAAKNGVSFGRLVTGSGRDFVALSNRTFGVDNPTTVNQFRTGIGLPNSGPRVGPIVINEIMYHPVTVIGTNVSENTDEEFIELFNITSNSVSLFDPTAATNHWQLGGGIGYTFPPNVSLSPGAFLVVVGFDPGTNAAALANFRAKYSIGTNISILGPFQGHLGDAAETVQLLQPDAPQIPPHPDAGFIPYVVVEAPSYTNSLPWPAAANGTGLSLQRRTLGSYGNDPINWVACSPNPGTRNCVSDTDGDGLPDDWELANGLNPYSASGPDGANGDPDQDGFANYQEFLAGTDPHNAQSLLKFTSITPIPGGVALRFPCIAGHTYTLQYRSILLAGAWLKLSDIGPFATNTTPTVNDVPGSSQGARFYRLVTPSVP